MGYDGIYNIYNLLECAIGVVNENNHGNNPYIKLFSISRTTMAIFFHCLKLELHQGKSLKGTQPADVFSTKLWIAYRRFTLW